MKKLLSLLFSALVFSSLASCSYEDLQSFDMSQIEIKEVENSLSNQEAETINKKVPTLNYEVIKWNVDEIEQINNNEEKITDNPIFRTLFVNHKEYLYKVGNMNEIHYDTLFETIDDIEVDANKLRVSFENIYGDVIYETNDEGTKWKDRTIKFSNSGIGTLKLRYDDVLEVSLNLEVIDAYNIERVPLLVCRKNTTNYNMCLLCNLKINVTSIYVDAGNTLYGNGFTISNRITRTNGEALNQSGLDYGQVFVMNGSTLDNVVLDFLIYPKSYLYATSGLEYVTEPENLCRTLGDKQYYAYQLSGVVISGDSTISNCYIKGARNNILVKSGNVKIVNTVCDRGSLANIHITSSDAYTVTLDNVTTVQYISDDDYEAGKKVEGLGVLIGKESSESNPEIIIKNGIHQYNWVSDADCEIIDSLRYFKDFIKETILRSAYSHTHNGHNYINTGFIVLNKQPFNITGITGYQLSNVSLYGKTAGQVYSFSKNAGTVIPLDGYEYSPTNNGYYVPMLKIDNLPLEKPEIHEYCFNDNGTIKIQFAIGSEYNLNIFDYINFERYSNEDVFIELTCEGAEVIDNRIIKFTKTMQSEIKINISNSKLFDESARQIGIINYNLSIPVEVTALNQTYQDASIEVSSEVNKTGVKMNSSGDRYYWFDIFDGLKIIDYDQEGKEVVVLDSNNQESKKEFISKIVSITPEGDLINGQGYTTPCTITITLDDARILQMSIKIEKNPKWTNSPGGPKAVYIRTDSSLSSLYYATYSAASSGGVTQNINDRIFACTYSIYDYSFVGNSGKKISTDTIHYMSSGLYDGVWTQPDTSQVRPTIYYSPSIN